MTEKKTWTETFSIRTDDVDYRGVATPTAILRLMQEAAWHHADALEFGYGALKSHGFFWVLSRMEIRFDHFPAWGSEVGVETWPSGVTKLFAHRDFRIFDADGLACEATSSWIVLSEGGGRPIRPERVLEANGPVRFGDLLFGHPAGKVELDDYDDLASGDPDAQAPADTGGSGHLVRVSDLDNQGHVNNAKYVEWCLDRYPPEHFAEWELAEATMNFLAESRWGQEMKISTTVTGGGAGFIDSAGSVDSAGTVDYVDRQTAAPRSAASPGAGSRASGAANSRLRIVQAVRNPDDAPVFALSELWVPRLDG